MYADDEEDEDKRGPRRMRVVVLARWTDLHNVLAQDECAWLDVTARRLKRVELVEPDATDWDIAALLQRCVKGKWLRQVLVLGVDDATRPLADRIVTVARSCESSSWTLYLVSEALTARLNKQYGVFLASDARWKLPSLILPALYLGDYSSAALSLELLEACGITHVINATNGFGNKHTKHLQYLDVNVDGTCRCVMPTTRTLTRLAQTTRASRLHSTLSVRRSSCARR